MTNRLPANGVVLRVLVVALCFLAAAVLGARPALATCQDTTAAGVIELYDGDPVPELVTFTDTDFDGLPETVACGSDTPTNLSSGTNPISGGSCDFAFDVLVGTSSPDSLSAPNNRPTVIFGGPEGDTLTGSDNDSYTDYIHGGASGTGSSDGDHLYGLRGDDFLCPSTNAHDATNETAEGGEGDDYIRGGPGPDNLHGGPGNDILQGAGGPDVVKGGDGDDYVGGGPNADLLYGDDPLVGGDEGDDILHGGRGADTFDGGPGTDTLYAVDYEDDTAVGGGADADNCVVDDGNIDSSKDDDTVTSCSSVTGRAACSGLADGPLLAAEVSGEVFVAGLDPFDGTELARTAKLSLGGPGVADGVAGLAVSPIDCDLYAVLSKSGTQYLARFDIPLGASDPLVANTANAISKSVDVHDIVDIGFDAAGVLHGLETDAELITLGSSTGVASQKVDQIGTLSTGHRLSFDDSDSGWFFAITSDGADLYHSTSFPSFAGFATEAFVGGGDVTVTMDDTMGEAIALDGYVGAAGKWHEIDSDGGMWLRERTGAWSRSPQGCPALQCDAAVESPASATMPHWYVP